jgi:hypothetical protein
LSAVCNASGKESKSTFSPFLSTPSARYSEISSSDNYDAIKQNSNTFFSKEQAEAAVALAQLSQLREVYRQGWVPDWTDGSEKHCILFYKNGQIYNLE